MPRPDAVRIALVLPTAWNYGADMARTILAETRTRPRWTLHLLRDRPTGRAAVARWLSEHPADGAIVLPRFPGCVAAVARQAACTIAVCDRPYPGIPHVGLDDQAVGRCAADHLRAAGARSLAYLRNRERWSADRERGLRDGAGPLAVAAHPPLADPDLPVRRLADWLAALPAPVGCFAGNDRCAATVLAACRLAGLEVPGRVRLLGADDDPLICLAERPALSSVRLPWAGIGRAAAQALARRLAGRPGPEHILLPPLGISARASTDPGGGSDPLVARALAVIATRVADGLNAAELAAETGVSASTLERRLRGVLGHGPLEAIRRARIERATALLDGPALPLAVVAHRAGFPSLTAMHAAFRTRIGCGPAAYRRRRGS